MEKLIKSKERLKAALSRLEGVFESVVAKLELAELENKALKVELLKFKNEKPVATRKKTVRAGEMEELKTEDLLSKNVFNEVDLSLKALRKMVG